MPKGYPNNLRTPQEPHGLPDAMRYPASIEDPDEVNPFLASGHEKLPKVDIDGYRTKWVRVGLGGDIDAENIHAHQFQLLRYELVRPEEVPGLSLFSTKINGIDSSVIRYRDCVLMKVPEKLARQYLAAEKIRADRQMGEIYQEAQNKLSSRFKTTRLVHEDEMEMGTRRNVRADED